MRIKNRLTPYPILDNYGDDYVGSRFDVEYDVIPQFTEIYGKLTFRLSNKELEQLIKEGRAEYTAHIECPLTCYRTIVSSSEPEVEFKINSNNVSNTLEIRTFIILKEDVNGYSSEQFHPDYMDKVFDLKKHQIVAIGKAVDYPIKHDDKDLDSLPSILQIVKSKNKKKGSLTVNTDGDDRILIGLSEDIYERYAILGKNNFKNSIFSLVLFPSLIIVLQRMYLNMDDSDMNSRHWFQVINNLLERNGYKLSEVSVDNDSLLSICQAIFADPILRSFNELESCSERMG